LPYLLFFVSFVYFRQVKYSGMTKKKTEVIATPALI